MPANLDALLRAIAADRGLQAGTTAAEYAGGVAATRLLNGILLGMIDVLNVNDDGRLSADDMARIGNTIYSGAGFGDKWRDFLKGHGNDNGNVETGYHLLQNDGGTLQFQGRNLIDTVIDAIFHFGFEVTDGRYVNEDGAANETTTDVAGWLNYFLNGENIIYGAAGGDEVGSGEYSNVFAAARNETFLMGNGADSVWADIGNDKVYAGAGADKIGAGLGTDRVFGEAGNDTIWGERGSDALYGGTGSDVIGGGDDNDRMYGGDMGDTVYGEDGNDLVDGGLRGDVLEGQDGADKIFGGQGHDKMGGGNGADRLIGGSDNDTMGGGNGTDSLRGGTGADELVLWEDMRARDTLIFSAGDSGKTLETMDIVMGFETGTDKIDLTAFGAMTFQGLDYTAGGRASCYYDGRYLRIDATGDGRTDMMVSFNGMDDLRAGDFIFA
jgi:Ca2+-binding RTX toxin-like protein